MITIADEKLLKNALPFWNRLTSQEEQKLTQLSNAVSYLKGAAIHNGLNECNGVLVVKTGTLRAYLVSEQGKEITLFKLNAGDVCVLTAGCIIKNISFEVFRMAETNAEVILLDKKTYDQLKQTYLEVEQFTNDILNQRFSDMMWALEKILFLSFDKRLAMFLLEQAESTNSNVITITHSQIASHIGSAREVVTRMLNHFADDHLVALSKGKIELTDVKKLKELL